jgi:hypothetical protein
VALDSLRLEDLSDREFLLIVTDVADEHDGWADSQEVANRLGLSKRRLASSRLSWLARWGAVEREHQRDEAGNIRYHRNGKPMHTQRWRLTTVGWALASGQMRKGLESQLARTDDAQMVVLTRWLARRQMGATAQKLTEREWQREALLRKAAAR